MDGGDGSGEASIDPSEENKEVDHGPTDLPPDTTVEPTDTIYYDTFEMLFGFTTSPPETTEEHFDYYDDQVRKRRDAPSMDGGDGSGEASIDPSEENKGVDHGSTDLPPDTTVEPTDYIYYDTFEMLFGFTTSPPETTEEHFDYYDGQVRKRRDAPSMDGGDGSGEASIDPSEENKGVDHGSTDLPPDTTVEPTDTIYYDSFDLLYGFTNSPPDTSEEHVDYYDDQVRKRRDAPSMDGGDGSGEASIDPSEENKGVDHGSTDLPPDTTVEPTDTIYYDSFDLLYGFTNSPPDTSEEHVDYYDDQVRKRRDAPSMDGGDGSGEASIDSSEENKGVDHGSTDLPPDTTVEPTDTIYYDTFGMLFGFTNSPPDTSEEHFDYYDDQVRERRDAPSMDGGDGSGEASIIQSEENKGVENAQQLDTIEPLESDVKQRSKRNAKVQTTFYGIFQLSDIACESGSRPSQNLCGLSCSALTDDDISDDIACLRVLLNS
ncbi:Sperm acrosome-associated protein 5, partial [Clarias magur]